MGLDMYLNKYPRYKDTTPDQIEAMEGLFDLQAAQAKGDHLDCNLEKWCGRKESELPAQDVVDFYRAQYQHRYSADDTEHRFGWMRVDQNVAYWRKANQIHAWFVENVQDGEDDCGSYMVSKESLEELLDICKELKEKVTLIPGKVPNGCRITAAGKEYLYEDGYIVTNPEVCEALLPTQEGFFFGGTDYDSYYMEDISRTIEMLEKILKETDFETEVVYYRSSW